MLLVGRNELVEEAYIVLREHTQVGYTIFQVGDTLDAKTESVAGVHLAIDAASLEHVRVYIPQPKISTQPVCLQKPQPLPPQMWQEMSISALGSVKGK